jgi:hypothetical protein
MMGQDSAQWKGNGRQIGKGRMEFEVVWVIHLSLPSPLCSEEAKKGKKEKDSEKPDTFVEKLAVHLTKNLQVCVLL